MRDSLALLHTGWLSNDDMQQQEDEDVYTATSVNTYMNDYLSLFLSIPSRTVLEGVSWLQKWCEVQQMDSAATLWVLWAFMIFLNEGKHAIQPQNMRLSKKFVSSVVRLDEAVLIVRPDYPALQDMWKTENKNKQLKPYELLVKQLCCFATYESAVSLKQVLLAKLASYKQNTEKADFNVVCSLVYKFLGFILQAINPNFHLLDASTLSLKTSASGLNMCVRLPSGKYILPDVNKIMTNTACLLNSFRSRYMRLLACIVSYTGEKPSKTGISDFEIQNSSKSDTSTQFNAKDTLDSLLHPICVQNLIQPQRLSLFFGEASDSLPRLQLQGEHLKGLYTALMHMYDACKYSQFSSQAEQLHLKFSRVITKLRQFQNVSAEEYLTMSVKKQCAYLLTAETVLRGKQSREAVRAALDTKKKKAKNHDATSAVYKKYVNSRQKTNVTKSLYTNDMVDEATPLQHAHFNEVTKLCSLVEVYLDSYFTLRHCPSTVLHLLHNIFFKNDIGSSVSSAQKVKVLPVLLALNTILHTPKCRGILRSSTGSGKTVVYPLIMVLMSYAEIYNKHYSSCDKCLDRPFICIILPSQLIVNEKKAFFKDKYSECNAFEVCHEEAQFRNYMQQRETLHSKPVILLTTAMPAIRCLYNLPPMTYQSMRICFDEAHTRSVELDILLAVLTRKVPIYKNTPFRLNFTLMSATPDDDLRQCLNIEDSEDLNIDSYPIYPTEVTRHVSNDRNIIEEVSKASVEALSNMFKAKDNPNQPYGHMLVFMSGLNECKRVGLEIQKLLRVSSASSVHICQTTLSEKDTFNSYIEKLNKDLKIVPSSKSCVLVTVLTGAVSLVQKELGYRPFPNELQHVIKVIVATNAIESSITIENLAVVVDSGLFKQSTYNPVTSVSQLETLAISEGSRLQRQGRVGRVAPGKCIQFYPDKGMKSRQLNKPAILLENIAQKALEQRNYRISLEKVNNDLPTPLEKTNLDQILLKLDRLKLIDGDVLTPLGKKVSKLSTLDPLYATAVVTQCEKGEVNGLFTIVIIALITTLNENFVNWSDKHTSLYNFLFCPYSDIVGLFNCAQPLLFSNMDVKSVTSSFGFVERTAYSFLSQINQCCNSIFNQSWKEQRSMLEGNLGQAQQTEAQVRELKKEYPTLHVEVFRHFRKHSDLFELIEKTIKVVEKLDEKWVALQTYEYKSTNITNDSNCTIYGNYAKSHTNVALRVYSRPMQVQPCNPSTIKVMCVISHESSKSLIGSLVHCASDVNVPIRVYDMYGKSFYHSPFYAPLLEVVTTYITQKLAQIKSIQLSKTKQLVSYHMLPDTFFINQVTRNMTEVQKEKLTLDSQAVLPCQRVMLQSHEIYESPIFQCLPSILHTFGYSAIYEVNKDVYVKLSCPPDQSEFHTTVYQGNELPPVYAVDFKSISQHISHPTKLEPVQLFSRRFSDYRTTVHLEISKHSMFLENSVQVGYLVENSLTTHLQQLNNFPRQPSASENDSILSQYIAQNNLPDDCKVKNINISVFNANERIGKSHTYLGFADKRKTSKKITSIPEGLRSMNQFDSLGDDIPNSWTSNSYQNGLSSTWGSDKSIASRLESNNYRLKSLCNQGTMLVLSSFDEDDAAQLPRYLEVQHSRSKGGPVTSCPSHIVYGIESTASELTLPKPENMSKKIFVDKCKMYQERLGFTCLHSHFREDICTIVCPNEKLQLNILEDMYPRQKRACLYIADDDETEAKSPYIDYSAQFQHLPFLESIHQRLLPFVERKLKLPNLTMITSLQAYKHAVEAFLDSFKQTTRKVPPKVQAYSTETTLVGCYAENASYVLINKTAEQNQAVFYELTQLSEEMTLSSFVHISDSNDMTDLDPTNSDHTLLESGFVGQKQTVQEPSLLKAILCQTEILAQNCRQIELENESARVDPIQVKDELCKALCVDGSVIEGPFNLFDCIPVFVIPGLPNELSSKLTTFANNDTFMEVQPNMPSLVTLHTLRFEHAHSFDLAEGRTLYLPFEEAHEALYQQHKDTYPTINITPHTQKWYKQEVLSEKTKDPLLNTMVSIYTHYQPKYKFPLPLKTIPVDDDLQYVLPTVLSLSHTDCRLVETIALQKVVLCPIEAEIDVQMLIERLKNLILLRNESKTNTGYSIEEFVALCDSKPVNYTAPEASSSLDLAAAKIRQQVSSNPAFLCGSCSKKNISSTPLALWYKTDADKDHPMCFHAPVCFECFEQTLQSKWMSVDPVRMLPLNSTNLLFTNKRKLDTFLYPMKTKTKKTGMFPIFSLLPFLSLANTKYAEQVQSCLLHALWAIVQQSVNVLKKGITKCPIPSHNRTYFHETCGQIMLACQVPQCDLVFCQYCVKWHSSASRNLMGQCLIYISEQARQEKDRREAEEKARIIREREAMEQARIRREREAMEQARIRREREAMEQARRYEEEQARNKPSCNIS